MCTAWSTLSHENARLYSAPEYLKVQAFVESFRISPKKYFTITLSAKKTHVFYKVHSIFEFREFFFFFCGLGVNGDDALLCNNIQIHIYTLCMPHNIIIFVHIYIYIYVFYALTAHTNQWNGYFMDYRCFGGPLLTSIPIQKC